MEKNHNNPYGIENPESRGENFENLLQNYLTDPNANPIEFGLHLGELGAGAKEYDNLIPILERATLPLAPLVQNYLLLMKGDTVEEVNQRVINFDLPTQMTMIRTRRMEMDDNNKNLFIVGSIMDEIAIRHGRASNYLKKNIETGGKRIKPVLIYAFSKYYDDSDDYARSGSDDEGLFYGDADDMGIGVTNNYFLELPENTQSGTRDKLIPHVAYLQYFDVSSIHEQRHANLIKQLTNPGGTTSSTLQQFSIIPKTYFNLELITHRMLTDLKMYAQQNP